MKKIHRLRKILTRWMKKKDQYNFNKTNEQAKDNYVLENDLDYEE